MENIRQNRYEKILICNSDHLHGKNRICIENKKTKNLKTSLDPKLNFLSSDVLAKYNLFFFIFQNTIFSPPEFFFYKSLVNTRILFNHGLTKRRVSCLGNKYSIIHARPPVNQPACSVWQLGSISQA